MSYCDSHKHTVVPPPSFPSEWGSEWESFALLWWPQSPCCFLTPLPPEKLLRSGRSGPSISSLTPGPRAPGWAYHTSRTVARPGPPGQVASVWCPGRPHAEEGPPVRAGQLQGLLAARSCSEARGTGQTEARPRGGRPRVWALVWNLRRWLSKRYSDKERTGEIWRLEKCVREVTLGVSSVSKKQMLLSSKQAKILCICCVCELNGTLLIIVRHKEFCYHYTYVKKKKDQVIGFS